MVNTYANVLQAYEPGTSATPSGLCMLCQRSAVWACQRCGDFYCSPECQRRDWQRHRYICFSMPGLTHATNAKMPEMAIEAKRGSVQLALPAPEVQPIESAAITDTEPAIVKMSNGHTETMKSSPSIVQPLKQVTVMTPPPSVMPPANAVVMLTCFRAANRCYVRSLAPSELDAYLLALKKIDAYGKMAPRLSALPKLNSFAIAEAEGVMCRVEVLAVRDPQSIRVLYCDYGTVAVQKLADLRMISDDILRLPQHAVCVKLRNVDNCAVSEPLMRFLAQFEDAEYQIRYGAEDERGGTAELYDCETKKCLNEEIQCFMRAGAHSSETGTRPKVPIESGPKKADTADAMLAALSLNKQTTPAKAPEPRQIEREPVAKAPTETAAPLPQQKQIILPTFATSTPKVTSPASSAEAPVLLPPFEIQLFKLNSANFKAIVLDTSAINYGYFGCIAESDLKHLIQVQEYLSKYEDTNKPYQPQLHEYCLARFENGWYRARVVSINDSRIAVMYLDFTNESTLTSEDIRRYPSELNGDCRTNLCLIDGLPTTLNAEHIKFLRKEIIVENKITIDRVKDFVQQIVVVECRSVTDKMRTLGLI